MTYSGILKSNLEQIGLTPDAVAFLLGVFGLIQVFDDVADQDPVLRPDLDKAVWFSFVGMAINPFYAANMQALTPVMATQILKWQSADAVERQGIADERSFIWRAGFYDLILTVACLCLGVGRATELGPQIMAMYGETFAEYMKEFPNA